MPLQEYGRILWRRGWIVLLPAMVTAASAFTFSKIKEERSPVYKSTVELLIQPARPGFGEAQATRALIESYVSWLGSTFRAEDVIEELQLDMTPAELRQEHVRISGDSLRLVIQLDVRHENAELANAIALTWAEQLVQWRNRQNEQLRREDRIEASILDYPQYSLDSPRTAVNTIAGSVLGALVGSTIVFALEFMEAGIVRAPVDIERYLNMNVLGAIPRSDS